MCTAISSTFVGLHSFLRLQGRFRTRRQQRGLEEPKHEDMVRSGERRKIRRCLFWFRHACHSWILGLAGGHE